MNALKSALVKIISADGVAGNGFVCQGGRVVTCAHVVAKALGTGDGSEEARPTDAVVVEFHWLQGVPRREATVIAGGWHPKLPNQSGVFDIAVLRMTGGVPSGVEPLVLARGSNDSFKVQAQPFIPTLEQTAPIFGEVVGRDEFNRLILRAENDYSQFVEPGVSGSAAFTLHGEVVQGIIEKRDTASPQAFLCPAAAIRSAISEIDVAEGAPAYQFMTSEEENTFANRRAAVFDILAPSQAAQPGHGVELQLSASFRRNDPAHLALREVEIQVEPPRSVTARRGAGEACVISGVAVEPFDIPRRPCWCLKASGDEALSALVEVDVPPLFVLPDPKPGEEIRATMTTFAHGTTAPDLEDTDLSDAKKKIIKHLRLREIGDPGEDGDILLGSVAGTVEEAAR